MSYYPSDPIFLTSGAPISLANVLYRTRVARILADADNQVASVIQRQPLKVVTPIEQKVIDNYATTYSLSANQKAILARLRLGYTNAIEMNYLRTILAGLIVPVTYLLRDQFPGSASAPLTSPRTSDPGPGTLTITDTGNKFSIASGRLVNTTAQSAFTDPVLAGALLTRTPGRVLRGIIKGAGWRLGFGNSGDAATPRAGIQAFAGNFYQMENGVGSVVVPQTNSIDYDLLVIQNDTGAITAVKGGAWAAYTMLYPNIYQDPGGNQRAGSTKVLYSVANSATELDTVELFDVGGIWSRSYSYAAYANYNPALPVAAFAAPSADMCIYIMWYAAAASIFEVYFRHTDDNNTWIVRGNSSDGTVRLIEKVAGVETDRTPYTAAVGATSGSFNQIVIRAEGTRITVGYNGAAKTSYTSASSNQTATGVKLPSSTSTPFKFFVWQLALPALPTVVGASAINIFPYGDSKTVGVGGDDAPYVGLGSGYPWRVCELAEASRSAGCFERPARVGRGGANTATLKANIDSDLASRTDTPDYVLYNVGANDVPAMPTQAQWQADTLYIWDAIHAKWPNAKIFVMKVWVRNQTANNNTYDDTWLPAAVALRSSFVYLHSALDERVFLENGDNGATYTSDGVHPNHAGYMLTAAKWHTALGI